MGYKLIFRKNNILCLFGFILIIILMILDYHRDFDKYKMCYSKFTWDEYLTWKDICFNARDYLSTGEYFKQEKSYYYMVRRKGVKSPLLENEINRNIIQKELYVAMKNAYPRFDFKNNEHFLKNISNVKLEYLFSSFKFGHPKKLIHSFIISFSYYGKYFENRLEWDSDGKRAIIYENYFSNQKDEVFQFQSRRNLTYREYFNMTNKNY